MAPHIAGTVAASRRDAVVNVRSNGGYGTGFDVRSQKTKECLLLSNAHVVQDGQLNAKALVSTYPSAENASYSECNTIVSGWETSRDIVNDYVLLNCSREFFQSVTNPFDLPTDQELDTRGTIEVGFVFIVSFWFSVLIHIFAEVPGPRLRTIWKWFGISVR